MEHGKISSKRQMLHFNQNSNSSQHVLLASC